MFLQDSKPHEEEVFDAVVVAIGNYHEPNLVSWLYPQHPATPFVSRKAMLMFSPCLLCFAAGH